MPKSNVCQHEYYDHEGWPEDEMCPDCYFAKAEVELDKTWAFGVRELDRHYSAELSALREQVKRLEEALRGMLYIFDRDLPNGSIGQRTCDEARETLTLRRI